MTPEQQRVAIAKLVGWIEDPHYEGRWVPPGEIIFTRKGLYHTAKPPDFLADRNAIVEAIMELNEREQGVFGDSLEAGMDVIHNDYYEGIQPSGNCYNWGQVFWVIATAPTPALCKAFLVAKGARG